MKNDIRKYMNVLNETILNEEMKQEEVTIKLPILVLADDYHDFPFMVNEFNKLNPSKKIKIKEVGFSAPKYVGVVYLSTAPSKSVIKELAAKQNIDLDDEE